MFQHLFHCLPFESSPVLFSEHWLCLGFFSALHIFEGVKPFKASLSGGLKKKPKAKANALRTELVKIRKVDNETNAETWNLSKTWREINAWWDYISLKIDLFKELDADFNF